MRRQMTIQYCTAKSARCDEMRNGRSMNYRVIKPRNGPSQYQTKSSAKLIGLSWTLMNRLDGYDARQACNVRAAVRIIQLSSTGRRQRSPARSALGMYSTTQYLVGGQPMEIGQWRGREREKRIKREKERRQEEGMNE